MKKLFFLLTLSIALFRFAENACAQTLTLDSIVGFPDSVFDNEQRGMSLRLTVTGGTEFTGDLAILMNAPQHDTVADTLYYIQADTISANGFVDSIQITYVFSAADLDGGDNIVVVWPVSQQGMVNPDSLLFHIVLKPSGTGDLEHLQAIHLYPNPSSDFLFLKYTHPEKVEQVRVFDMVGKEIFTFNEAVSRFSVEMLCSGVYFVEVKNKDHSVIAEKFFRE
jgi:hypothetical protein